MFYFKIDINERWTDQQTERQIKMEDNEKHIKLHLKPAGACLKHVGEHTILNVSTVVVCTYNKSI